MLFSVFFSRTVPSTGEFFFLSGIEPMYINPGRVSNDTNTVLKSQHIFDVVKRAECEGEHFFVQKAV